MARLDGKVAVVTGASKGIGAGIAEAFAAAGAKVVVNYAASREDADAVAQAITAAGGEAIAVGADVSKAEQARRLVATAGERFGRLFLEQPHVAGGRLSSATGAVSRSTAIASSHRTVVPQFSKRSDDVYFCHYDAVVPSNLQILGALDQVMAKAKSFCAERGSPEAEMIDARLAPDMFPLGYQVKSCVVHSITAIEGARTGSLSPDWSAWPTDFDGLRGILQRASAELYALDRNTVDRLAGTDLNFVAGERKLPFNGANFLLSFSQPNFYFHATTAYAILRARGVSLGKRDFLGVLRADR